MVVTIFLEENNLKYAKSKNKKNRKEQKCTNWMSYGELCTRVRKLNEELYKQYRKKDWILKKKKTKI